MNGSAGMACSEKIRVCKPDQFPVNCAGVLDGSSIGRLDLGSWALEISVCFDTGFLSDQHCTLPSVLLTFSCLPYPDATSVYRHSSNILRIGTRIRAITDQSCHTTPYLPGFL